MSKNYEITGDIHTIGETTVYGDNGFQKREFVIKITGEDENPEYPQYAPIELIKDKCGIMDAFAVGQEVKIQFNINGRLWEGNGKGERCFSAFQAWKVEAIGPAPTGSGATGNIPQGSGFDPSAEDDTIPFRQSLT